MLKKLAVLFCALSVAFAFTSCNEEPGNGTNPETTQLKAPVISIDAQTETSFTISWKTVSNADSYTYVFQGEEATTTKKNLTFDGLSLGTYEVKVKATSEKEEFTDSDFATITVTLEKEDLSWFTQVLELRDDPDQGATPYNAVFITWAGTGVTDVKYGAFEASSSKSLSDEELIANLTQSIPADYLEAVNDRGLTATIPAEASTEYEIAAYATNAAGKKILCRGTITTEELPDSDPDMAKWFGDWSVTTTHTFRWNLTNDGYLDPEYLEEPMTFEIAIADAGEYNTFIIYGLSTLDPTIPAIALFDSSNKTLNIIGGIMLSDFGDGGYATAWGTNILVNDGSQTIIGAMFYEEPVYTMFMNSTEDGATSERAFGSFTDGSEYEVIGMEVYAYYENGQYGPFGSADSFPQNYRGGDFTFTKISDEPTIPASASAVKNVNRPVMTVFNAIVK